jgi:predicted N-acyltransferase
VKTWSVHWIAHSGFKQAVSRFLMAEERGIDQEANHITMASPFKRGGTQD